MVRFPNHITAGETLKACVRSSEATAILAVFVGPQKHEVAFDRSGDEWTAEEDTAPWYAGRYAWEAWVTLEGGEKWVCGRGAIGVSGSLADEAAGFEARSTAEQNVAKLEAMLGGKAADGVRRYRINNRELESYSIAELMELLAYWKGQWKRERRRAQGRSVLGANVRFRI